MLQNTCQNLWDNHAVVPADKVPNNIVFVCKYHYINCFINELEIKIHLETQHSRWKPDWNKTKESKLFVREGGNGLL